MTVGRYDAARMRFADAVAAAVKSARAVSGLTQRAMAEKTGLSHSMIVNIEDGRTSPSLWAIARIAEVLDTTIDALAPVLIDVKEKHDARA